MKTDLEILRELLKKEVLVEIEESHNGRKIVKLHEPKCTEHNGYTVAIQQIPNDVVVVKIDKFPAPKTIFNGSEGECKRADFVIITQMTIKQKKKNLIIFIELKKGKGGSEADIIQQLKGAKCVITYCRSIGQEFWKQQDFLNPNKYEYRFVSIRNIGLNKRVSYEKPKQGLHNCPEKMLKITSPNYLEFRKLV